nr:nuclease-related domain-containing protein [Olsenella intestinalis]
MREGTGGLGEYLIEYGIEHGKLPGRIEVFRNVLVPRKKGPTDESEVDVLLLHETGLYVIESKNYSGWIFGSEGQRQWTQTLEGGKKERFYNPIMQNRAHVRALAACLGVEREQMRSYVVFSERCTLKKVPDDCEEYVVCRRPRLLERLRADMASRGTVFDEARMDELVEKIAALVEGSTKAAKDAHVEQVKRYVSGR